MQQRAASLTLAPKPEAVQSVADQVAQLTVREGGFVQSSHVRRQSGAGGSAELRLSLPSARLTAALASLGRLAPTREESQSLQDITDEYGAARRKLADAVAERQALLRALARASTQSQIESLHARIALAAAAVTRARTAFGAISRRGSNSTVEVTVLGDAHAGSDRSTLGNGLHDALDVLKAVAVVLLVALAVLVPLALVLALAGARLARVATPPARARAVLALRRLRRDAARGGWARRVSSRTDLRVSSLGSSLNTKLATQPVCCASTPDRRTKGTPWQPSDATSRAWN